MTTAGYAPCADLRIGLVLPSKGRGTGPEVLDAGAAVARQLGWASVWVTDHLLVPSGPEADEYGTILEALTALTYVAARHDDLRVGVSAIVPAMRDAPLLAKQIATLDVLSGGRVTIAVGVGDRDDLPEYANLGKADRFTSRGAYVDEAIALWRHLWSGSTAPFRGRFHELADFTFLPLPPQGADLPIWCGGRSERALQRAARLADGYHAAQTGPQDLVERLPLLAELATAAGRPLPTVSVRTRVKFDHGPIGVYSLHGDTAAMARELLAFYDAGVEELIVVFDAVAPDEMVAQARRFDAEVVQPFREQLARRSA